MKNNTSMIRRVTSLKTAKGKMFFAVMGELLCYMEMSNRGICTERNRCPVVFLFKNILVFKIEKKRY